ncbi:MAG TPA: hypothetical protein VGK52_15695 [Polyangia bacterium]
MVDHSRSSGAFVDPSAFPATPSTSFWSSSLVPGLPTSAWSVAFNTGHVHHRNCDYAGSSMRSRMTACARVSTSRHVRR